MPQRHFVKYTFLKVDPAWRRLDEDERSRHKREFLAACEDFASERLLRAFSLVGTRGDADLLLLTPGDEPRADPRVPRRARPERPDEVVRDAVLVPGDDQAVRVLRRVAARGPPGARASTCSSTRSSRRASGTGCRPTSAGGSCRSTSRSAASIPQIDLNTSYSFGLDDQEFVVAFETDEPGSLPGPRAAPAHDRVVLAYTKRDTPTFTCVSCSVERALNALDGTPLSGRCRHDHRRSSRTSTRSATSP